MSPKRKLIILTGPTAVGKTELSIALAKKIGGEIISADSVQVYKDMNIGSAKIKKEEMQGVTHHLIDILDPTSDFDVFLFQKLAKQAMLEIYKRGNIPIIVGGTGFYIQAVLYDIDFQEKEEETSSAFRRELEELAFKNGNHYMHELLKDIDESAAEQIHENNVKRVIRAIEYYKETGQKISDHNKQQRQKESPYAFTYFVLNDEREKLYSKIEKRVDIMLENGLVDEVRGLLEKGCKRENISMQALGYKEIMDYLEGSITLEEASYRIKRDTRHFAKRQITWFKRERDVIWINKNEFAYKDDMILQYMTEHIRK